MFKRNVSFSHRVKVSNWRKTTYGTWTVPGDSQAYCIQTVDVAPALKLINESHEKITLTHLVGVVVGKITEEFPEINRIIRFGNFYQRSDISVFFQVSVDQEGRDLTGYTVRNINQKSYSDVAREMRESVARIKTGDDFQYKKIKKTMGFIPTILTPLIIKIYGNILYNLNIWTKFFGAPQDAFGSVMITNIGGLGLQTALAPLVPYSRVPVILTMGKVYDKVVAKNGEIVIQKSMDCGWTLDHRLIDGVVGAKIAERFEDLLANPEKFRP